MTPGSDGSTRPTASSAAARSEARQEVPLPSLKRMRRKVTRSRPFLDLVGFVSWCVMAGLARTVRLTWKVDPEYEGLDADRVLYAFWHGRQFLLIWGFRGRGVVTLVEKSWAGEVQRRVMGRFGYRFVRGSSKRRPAEALVRLVRTLRERGPGTLAVDGPKGPVHRAKPGIVHLARTLDWPIVPVSASSSTALSIRETWCRYLLPAPFARGVIVVGAPIRPDEGFDTTDLDRRLDEVTAEADRLAGRRERCV